MVDSKHVFLVSGQLHEAKLGGRIGLKPKVEQRVVVATSDSDAYQKLSESAPDFHPLGFTTLHDLEQACATIHAVLKGTSTTWPVIGKPT